MRHHGLLHAQKLHHLSQSLVAVVAPAASEIESAAIETVRLAAGSVKVTVSCGGVAPRSLLLNRFTV